MAVTCKECNKHFPKAKKLCNTHLKNNHSMSMVQYELKHGQYSTLDVNEVKTINPEQRIICNECNFEFTNIISHNHLKHHNMTVAEYKEKYGEYSVCSDSERNRRKSVMSGTSNHNYGNKYSDEVRSKMSEKIKEQYANGRTANNKGETLSGEHKQRISEAKRNQD